MQNRKSKTYKKWGSYQIKERGGGVCFEATKNPNKRRIQHSHKMFGYSANCKANASFFVFSKAIKQNHWNY